jgi:hypothetical protein
MRGKSFFIRIERLLIAFFSFFVVLCFAACNNVPETPTTVPVMSEPGYGKVTVNIAGIGIYNTSARTVYPDMLFAKYEFEFSKVNDNGDITGTIEPKELATGEAFVFELEVGKWQVTVSAFAKAGDTEPAAAGTSEPFTLTSGTTILTADVQLDGIVTTGSGTFSYYITFPADAEVTLFSLEKLSAEENPESINLLETSEVGAIESNTIIVSGTVQDITAGYYLMTLLLEMDGAKTGANEVVYIYDKLGSAYGTEDEPVVFIEDHFSAPVLTGTVSISGTAQVGQTLTANTGNLGGSGTISYQWNRGGTAISGAKGSTYTIQSADEGSTITVTVTRFGYSGNVTSAPTATVALPLESITGLANKLAWLKTYAQSNGNYLIEVNADESIIPQALSYSGKNNISITLRGIDAERTISLSSNGSFFTVQSGVTLILDNNITLQGHNNNNASLVYVISSGKLIMNTGSKISGNQKVFYSNSSYPDSNDGGGVYVYNGTFTMNGGEISGNTAFINGFSSSSSISSCGGGVYVESGTFTMNDGVISGNTASASAVYARSYGGGVYVNGIFTMNGGEISGNTAFCSGPYPSPYGGGVYVYSGTFTKTDGTIYGYVDANSNIVKNDFGVVSNRGHAVYVNTTPGKFRESTAGPTVNLDSNVTGTAGGWEN